MPRNPDKARCSVPGCRSAAEIPSLSRDRTWAMRDHERCRPHRDAALGPRGVGAPLANLNALQAGDHAHLLSLPEREQLVAAIVADPDALPHRLSQLIPLLAALVRDLQALIERTTLR